MRGQTPIAAYDFVVEAVDVSGNGNDLSFDGEPFSEFVSEECRRYLEVVDDGYLRKDMPNLDITDTFTVAFWMRTSDLMSDQKIVGQAVPGERGFVIGPDGGKIKPEVFGEVDYVLTSNHDLVAGEWTHVAVTYESGFAFSLYINGALDKVLNLENQPAWTPATDSTDDLIVGGAPWFPSELSYTGDLDDLVIYNVALSPSMITDIYNDIGTCPSLGDPIYIDELAIGGNNGLTWGDAYNDLQDAIDKSCHCPDAPIWVAEGTYRPTYVNDVNSDDIFEIKEKTFYIDHAVQIYGGFTSGATMLTDRDSLGGGTILTGVLEDMGTDTAYHVITMEAETIDADWILDGLVIRDGRATGSHFNHKDGGGIYNVFRSSEIFSPIIQNCRITNNGASDDGGGIYAEAFANAFAIGNDANANATSSQSIINSTFYNNSATNGGGIYTDAFVDFISIANSSDATISPMLSNAIFWGNKATDEGPDIWKYDSDVGLPNGTISHSILSSSSSVEGMITTYADTLIRDPLFVDVADNNLQLSPGSPAFNTGDNSVAMGIITDLAGNDRIRYGTVDMGAYEYRTSCSDALRFFLPGTFDHADDFIGTNEDIEISSGILNDSDIFFSMNNGMTMLKEFSVELGSQMAINLDGCLP